MIITKNKKEIYIIPIMINGLICNNDKEIKITQIGQINEINTGWNIIWNTNEYLNFDNNVKLSDIKDYLYLFFDYNGTCLNNNKINYIFNFYVENSLLFKYDLEINII